MRLEPASIEGLALQRVLESNLIAAREAVRALTDDRLTALGISLDTMKLVVQGEKDRREA